MGRSTINKSLKGPGCKYKKWRSPFADLDSAYKGKPGQVKEGGKVQRGRKVKTIRRER